MDEPILNQEIPGKNREKLMKILVPIFVVIFIGILFLVKRQNPEFPIGYVILIGVVIIIIGGIAFFGFDIANKFRNIKEKEKDKNILPEPADTRILWDKAKISVTNEIYRDHITEYLQTINHSVGKNRKSLVVEFQVRTLYRPRKRCSIILNANYPNRLPTVIFDPSPDNLKHAIQSMSFDPEDPANEEETTVKNEMTGTTATTKRKTYVKKSDTNNNEKKEQLV